MHRRRARPQNRSASLEQPVPAEPQAENEPAPRRIWLCADDYGISPSVSKAIRDLIMMERLNATSVMVLAPSFNRSEAASLNVIAAARRAAIGLHLTLTGKFKPLSAGFAPLDAGTFLSMDEMLKRCLLRRLDRKALRREINAQIEAFIAAFGHPPDYIDGHQHVHLFPQVRDELLAAMKQLAPDAWVRQCGRTIPLSQRFSDPKGLVLDLLSGTFRRKAAARGIRTNPAFAGTYDFFANPAPDFATLFPAFVKDMPAGGLVMCHPGFVDAELERLDPLTTPREREFAYLADDAFPDVLRRHGVALA
jgi:predicted glycoside hydrolase/deacetylase ChbG (UPF0249 family)